MFGLVNKTSSFARKYVAKIGSFAIDVAYGFVEEVTFNITNVQPAHAAILPDQIAQPVTINGSLAKSLSISAASAVTSTQVRSKVFEIIYTATWNLI